MWRVTLVASALAAALVPAMALASPEARDVESLHLYAKLTGTAEAPKPGAPQGQGVVQFKVDRTARKLCWAFRGVRGVRSPSAAHIHRGAAGAPGPVVVPLGSSYRPKGCTRLIANDMVDFLKAPGSYYVNVHSAQFPDGAIRGQVTGGLATPGAINW